MKNTVKALFGSCLMILLSGCAVTNLTSDIDPDANLESLRSIYVVRQPNDRRGIEEMIALELRKYGKDAFHGDNAEPPANVDAILTYVDKWMWDITNYLLDLRIELRHPETGYILATGNSYRTSLARKSPEGMVKEVIGETFGIQNRQE
ncbi:MAG: hypothetical protein WD005_04815 [Haliea sp.]